MANAITMLAAAAAHHHHHKHHAGKLATAGHDPLARLQSFLDSLAIALGGAVALGLTGALVGWLFHRHGRYRPSVGLVATVPLPALAAGIAALAGHRALGTAGALVVLVGQAVTGVRLDQADRRAGKDRRRRAERRLGLIGACRALWIARKIATAEPGHDEVIVGRTSTRVVRLVHGWGSGRHVGVLGAPGSGKSTTIAALLEQHVCGVDGLRHGAVIIDPKGDPAIRTAARASAQAAGAPLVEFTPHGGVVYDVLAGGDVDRRTDKLLAAEDWTEPHYLAGATTYLREVMRTLEATGQHPTLSRVLALMDPDKHENAAAEAGKAYAKQLATTSSRSHPATVPTSWACATASPPSAAPTWPPGWTPTATRPRRASISPTPSSARR